jgi:hypothetical protein
MDRPFLVCVCVSVCVCVCVWMDRSFFAVHIFLEIKINTKGDVLCALRDMGALCLLCLLSLARARARARALSLSRVCVCVCVARKYLLLHLQRSAPQVKVLNVALQRLIHACVPAHAPAPTTRILRGCPHGGTKALVSGLLIPKL